MRKLFLALMLLSSPVFAVPKYYGTSVPASGKITQYVSGNICVAASSATAGTCAVNVNGTGTVTATTFAGNATTATTATTTSGNAATATALASTPSKCSVGNYPLGVDASGNAQNCAAVGIGDVTQAGNNAFTGTNKFSNSVQYVGPNGIGLYPGMMVLVSSQVVSGVSGSTVAIPSGSYSQFIVIGKLKNVTGSNTELGIHFNGDVGANYTFMTTGYDYTGIGGTGCGAGSKLGNLTGINDIGVNGWMTFQFNVNIASSSVTTLDGISTFQDLNSLSAYTNRSSLIWSGSGPPTTMTLFFGSDTGSCGTPITAGATGTTGTVYVFALPF
jgi:hypothetical protein